MCINDLYYATNLFNNTFILDSLKISERINTLNINSDFIIKCSEIVNDDKINSWFFFSTEQSHQLHDKLHYQNLILLFLLFIYYLFQV